MDPRPQGRFYRLRYGLLLSTSALMLWIALTTPYNTHPDEGIHVDAICYFEQHRWPPPLNADGLVYSPDGWSRVYSGELVYLVYGQAANRLHPLFAAVKAVVDARAQEHTLSARAWFPLAFGNDACTIYHQLYRLLNVVLWVVTLGGLLIVGRRRPGVAGLALLLCSVPQVIYLYSYANSDAWALSASCLLFVFAVTRDPHRGVRGWDMVGVGLLTGLVLLAKQPFWLTIPFSLLVWLAAPERYAQPGAAAVVRQAASWLAVVALVAFLVILPLKLVYPLSQPAYTQQVAEMRSQRARWDFQPNSPLYAGFMLADRGVSLGDVWAKDWLQISLESFYGVFGYMLVWLPRWVYWTAGGLMLAGVAATAVDFAQRHRAYTLHDKLVLAATPFFLALPVAASLRFSWTVDFQPQGRYLFAALLPLALLVGGVSSSEPRLLRRLRGAMWVALLVLSHYALVTALVLDRGPH